jgi:hypothetical protein
MPKRSRQFKKMYEFSSLLLFIRKMESVNPRVLKIDVKQHASKKIIVFQEPPPLTAYDFSHENLSPYLLSLFLKHF